MTNGILKPSCTDKQCPPRTVSNTRRKTLARNAPLVATTAGAHNTVRLNQIRTANTARQARRPPHQARCPPRQARLLSLQPRLP